MCGKLCGRTMMAASIAVVVCSRVCRYEELEQKRLADLVQSFADRMIDVSKRGKHGSRAGLGFASVGLVAGTVMYGVLRSLRLRLPVGVLA